MFTKFLCPDNLSVPISDCLKQCVKSARCFPIPILKRMGQTRPAWTPAYKWSVTELLQPMRYLYLQKTQDYAEAPQDLLFKILGSAYHYFVNKDDPDYLQEYHLENEFYRGTIDAYSISERGLYDYKFVQRYKARMLTQDLEKEGKDYIWQLNAYRLLLEEKGYPVDKMVLVIVCRDHRGYEYKAELENVGKKTKAGKPYALPIDPCYQFCIPKIGDESIRSILRQQANELSLAFQTQILPPKCSDEETWTGKRCESYCPVNLFCPDWIKFQKEAKNE